MGRIEALAGRHVVCGDGRSCRDILQVRVAGQSPVQASRIVCGVDVVAGKYEFAICMGGKANRHGHVQMIAGTSQRTLAKWKSAQYRLSYLMTRAMRDVCAATGSFPPKARAARMKDS